MKGPSTLAHDYDMVMLDVESSPVRLSRHVRTLHHHSVGFSLCQKRPDCSPMSPSASKTGV